VNRSEAVLVDTLTFRTSQMRRENHSRSMFSRVFNCGNCRANARVVVDLAVFDRDVEIDANEDAPSFKIEISD